MSSIVTNRFSNEEIIQRLRRCLRKGVFINMGPRPSKLTPEQELDINEIIELLFVINDDHDLQRDVITTFKQYSHVLYKHLRIDNLINAKIALSINDRYYLSTDKNEEITTHFLKRILKIKKKTPHWYQSHNYKSILNDINYTTKRHFQSSLWSLPYSSNSVHT